MKNILIPTDFSPNAEAAALCAAMLARLTDARLILLHVLSPLTLAGDLSAEARAQELLDTAASELHITNQISVTRLLKPGLATDEIPMIAERIKADLILLGAKGTGNHTATRAGSVASQLLLTVQVHPIICCPPDTKLLSLDTFQWSLHIDEQLCNAKGLIFLHQFRPISKSERTA